MAVLSTIDVVAGYKTGNVLHGISIDVEPGEIVAVIGRNGVGKSTLLRAIIGLLPLRSGSIIFQSDDISNESADLRARRGVGYVPQGRGIFPQLTVHENLRMGTFINETRAEPDFDMIFEFFPLLKERRNQRGGTLSGGQQALLSIARALVCLPDLLLLDEPSDGVQPSIVEEIGEFLVELNQTLGISILLVEQNINLLQKTAHRAYAMEKGQVTSALSRDELKDEKILAAHITV